MFSPDLDDMQSSISKGTYRKLKKKNTAVQKCTHKDEFSVICLPWLLYFHTTLLIYLDVTVLLV